MFLNIPRTRCIQNPSIDLKNLEARSTFDQNNILHAIKYMK